MGLETLLPILIKYVIIPEVAKVVRANPTLDDAGIIAKLPDDIQGLATSNQAFLDSIRTQAGR